VRVVGDIGSMYFETKRHTASGSHLQSDPIYVSTTSTYYGGSNTTVMGGGIREVHTFTDFKFSDWTMHHRIDGAQETWTFLLPDPDDSELHNWLRAASDRAHAQRAAQDAAALAQRLAPPEEQERIRQAALADFRALRGPGDGIDVISWPEDVRQGPYGYVYFDAVRGRVFYKARHMVAWGLPDDQGVWLPAYQCKLELISGLLRLVHIQVPGDWATFAPHADPANTYGRDLMIGSGDRAEPLKLGLARATAAAHARFVAEHPDLSRTDYVPMALIQELVHIHLRRRHAGVPPEELEQMRATESQIRALFLQWGYPELLSSKT